MKTVYLDTDFKCYVTSGEGRTQVETDTFDGKCDAYIEGYRHIPAVGRGHVPMAQFSPAK